MNEKCDDFLLAYLYVHYVVFFPTLMRMHVKLTNSFGNWLIVRVVRDRIFQKWIVCAALDGVFLPSLRVAGRGAAGSRAQPHRAGTATTDTTAPADRHDALGKRRSGAHYGRC